MKFSVRRCEFQEIAKWRKYYVAEMGCQIVHDSLHLRTGWAEPHLLLADDNEIGYASILVGGPWEGTRTLFEYYLSEENRTLLTRQFFRFVEFAAVTAVQAQTSDSLLTTLLHWVCVDVRSEKIVFKDGVKTRLPAGGAIVVKLGQEEQAKVFPHQREPVGDFGLRVGDKIVATGGLAWHYNPPYGDIHMEVEGPYRRQGFGSYFVQELKNVCYDRGGIPCARCDTGNLASISTVQKAGLVPSGHILVGRVQLPHRCNE